MTKKNKRIKIVKSRWEETVYLWRIIVEFIKSIHRFHFKGHSVTIFGSARFLSTHPYYMQTQELAYKISKLGYNIITGGGPGLMEAANKGAKEAKKGLSIGYNIILPNEQQPNFYLDKKLNVKFFFVRKELLRKYSAAFVVMPGGLGTLDEFFEIFTLMQTGKMESLPIVLIGTKYYGELIKYLNRIVNEGVLNKEDLLLIKCTDNIDEAVHFIDDFISNNIVTY